MEFDVAVETLDVLKITGKDILHCPALFFLECSVIIPGQRFFFTKKIILIENQPMRDMKWQQERTLLHLNYLLNGDQGILSCAG